MLETVYSNQINESHKENSTLGIGFPAQHDDETLIHCETYPEKAYHLQSMEFYC
jgi:hypothetical protein